MKKSIIFTVLFGLCLSFSMAGNRQLTDFQAILDALKTGHKVRAVFHYKDCQLISDNEIEENVPDAIGGMDLDTFEYFAPGSIRNKEGFISASKTVLISHPRYGYVHNYAKVRIQDDGKVRIIARYLAPGTLETKMDESFYTTVNDKKNKGAAYFYLID